MSLESFTPEDILNNAYNVMLITKRQIQNVITNLKNTKKVHLLVLSDEQLSSNNEWSIIMQQQFNGCYLVLIKKVTYSEFFTLRNINITCNLLYFRSKKNQL